MKRASFLATAAALTLATTAFAQPTPNVDLGSIANPSTTTGTLTGFTAGQVQWIKVTIPSVSRALQQYFDVTLNGGTLSSVDSHMGFFDNAGNFIVSDDDDGPSNYSQLSFGDTTPARSAIAFTGNATANGTTRAGPDGALLAAGTYWIAVTGFGGNTYAAPWTVGTTHTATGDITYRVELGTDATPSVLSATYASAGVAPAASPYMNGDQVRITATVSPFNGPPVNLNITATANLTAIGGSSTQNLFDDGTNGDLVAGDLIYSYVQTISGTTAGTTTAAMPVSVSDDAAHTASGNVTGLAITRYGNMGTPTTFTDLGTWSCSGNSGTFTHVDGGATGPWGDRVRWYKIVLPAAVAGASSGSYVDIFTSNVGSAITDPEMAIFDNSGIKIAEDDQDGADSHAAMSFGQTTPNRTAQSPNSVAHNGRDGALAAGTYWIATGDFNMNFPTTGAANGNWRVTSNDTTTTAGVLNLEIRAVDPSCTTPPTGVGAAAPTSGQASSNALFTVTVTPGASPVSTGITVSADLSLIGGSPTQAFFNDGTNGDVTGGDSIWSYNATIGAVGGGLKTMPFTVQDAQSRSSGGNLAFTVVAPPAVFTDLGSPLCTPLTTSTNVTVAGEVKWFKVTLPAAPAGPSSGAWVDMWTASTGTLSDTEMALFDNSGALIAESDDDGNGLKSMLTFGQTTPNRTNIDGTDALDGVNGALAGGVYWLATGDFSMTFANGWSATAGTDLGTINIQINAGNNTCITNPTGVMAVAPSPTNSGANAVFTVTVTPGTNPVSAGLTVTGNLSSLVGGSAAQAFSDDGLTGGDVTAGDNIFTWTHAMAASEPNGAKTVTFTVADNFPRSTGPTNFNFTNNGPTNPSGTGTATPNTAGICSSTSVVLSLTVTPGANPVSSGIGVTVDLTNLGGSASTSMLDNGVAPDAAAGDNIFTLGFLANGSSDVNSIPFTITDAQSRSATGSIAFTRDAAGDLPATAKKYYGTTPASVITGNINGGTDVDMFAICVSDTANFEARTNNGGATYDTQLFLFNANGTGAAENDDEPDVAQTLQSHMMLNNSLLPAAPPIVLPSGGLYYLALAPYNRDPISSAAVTDLIWNNTATTPADSFDATWAPNGITPLAPVTGWTNTGNSGGPFTLTLVGATTVCPADLADITGAGNPDCGVDINDLLYFLAQFEAGSLGADLSNISGTGVPDCGVDINDLLFFLAHFEGGC